MGSVLSDGAGARVDEEYEEEVGEARPCVGKWLPRGEGWSCWHWTVYSGGGGYTLSSSSSAGIAGMGAFSAIIIFQVSALDCRPSDMSMQDTRENTTASRGFQ